MHLPGHSFSLAFQVLSRSTAAWNTLLKPSAEVSTRLPLRQLNTGTCAIPSPGPSRVYVSVTSLPSPLLLVLMLSLGGVDATVAERFEMVSSANMSFQFASKLKPCFF